MYGHGFATLFLAEVYGASPQPGLREKLSKAIELIVHSQNAEGGWRYEPRRDYGYERYDEPVRYRYRPEPWTDEWYVYCDQKYKTFDPRTGKFRGYDGKLHFCR